MFVGTAGAVSYIYNNQTCRTCHAGGHAVHAGQYKVIELERERHWFHLDLEREMPRGDCDNGMSRYFSGLLGHLVFRH